jgi:hypothetical protein
VITSNTETWQRAPKNQAHTTVFTHVQRIEQEQGATFDRFLKLEALYDPNNPDAADAGEQLAPENVVASNVDTVTAAIATTEVRARFMTDDGDWGTQRTARHLEWYAEGLSKLFDVLPRCRGAFKECTKKGNGLVKAHIVLGQIRVERVLVENIVVDDAECRDGKSPRQMHQWDLVDADELVSQFPDAETDIQRARQHRHSWRQWRRTRATDNNVELLETWLLPIGMKGKKGYKPGRHTKCIDGKTLLDEVWEWDFFPIAVIVWSERIASWYGISGAERIAGIQRALNKRNWQIERQLDRCAAPTTYVRPVDAKLAVTASKVGAIVPIRGDWPQTITPQAVNAETYQNRVDLREAANNEFGQSQMATHATKPAGIDSGVALREYKDQSSQRFATQEKAFEQLVLDTIWLVIHWCKQLGAEAPTDAAPHALRKEAAAVVDVDMKDAKVQIAPRRTSAARRRAASSS